MRLAKVFHKNEVAGTITQLDNGSFIFEYTELWYKADNKPSISPTLPKRKKEFRSEHLFSFFFNMIPEGSNLQTVCTSYGIDKDDYFGILLAVANHDTIGAVTIERQNIESEPT